MGRGSSKVELSEEDFLPFSATTVADPFHFSHKRSRGSKREGHQYEVAVTKAILSIFPSALCGQWFLSNGRYCQPDIIIPLQGIALVLEVKRTDKGPRQAAAQLQKYLPIVASALALPTRGIVVAKFLSSLTDLPSIVTSLSDALLRPLFSTPVLHAPWPTHPDTWQLQPDTGQSSLPSSQSSTLSLPPSSLEP